MLRKGVIGHILRNKKPLIAFTAIPNEIRQSFMPQFTDPRCLLNELLGVGPSQLSELLDGDPTAIVLVLKAAFVNDIGGFFAALGNDVIGAEVVGSGLEVGEGELGESRDATGKGGGIRRAIRRMRLKIVVGVRDMVVFASS